MQAKVPDLPAFLRRGSKEHRALLKRTAGKTAALKSGDTVDPDAWKHEEAVTFRLKRGAYNVRWFDDPKWLASMRAQREEREAKERAQREERERKAAALREERRVMGDGRPRAGRRRAPRVDKLPQGRIVVTNARNPKKEGSDPWQRWNTLLTKCNGITVEAYALAGHNTTTLANAVKRGHVQIKREDEIDATKREAETAAESDQREQTKSPRRARADAADGPARKVRRAGPARRKSRGK